MAALLCGRARVYLAAFAFSRRIKVFFVQQYSCLTYFALLVIANHHLYSFNVRLFNQEKTWPQILSVFFTFDAADFKRVSALAVKMPESSQYGIETDCMTLQV